MSETLFILGADKEFRTLEHLLNHHAGGSLYLHHAVKLKGKVFWRTDIQGNTAHIALMNRSHHLGHYGISHLLGKVSQRFLVVAHHLRHHRNAGTFQELMHDIWCHVTIFLDASDDIPYARHIHAKEFYLGSSRRRRTDDACQCGGERHFVRKIHMAFLQKLGHFGTCRMHTRQDGEDRLVAFLDLLMKHIVCRIELYQSRSAKDNEDGINLWEPLIAVVDGNAQLLGRSRGQNIYRITHGSTSKELALQLLCGRTLQFGNLHSAL